MEKTILLTFDDAVTSQYHLVAPLLRRLGFGATFYVCRFPDAWRAAHSRALLSAEQLKELSDAGFEIGNHTWNHPDLRRCDEKTILREVDELDSFLIHAGIPKSSS